MMLFEASQRMAELEKQMGEVEAKNKYLEYSLKESQQKLKT